VPIEFPATEHNKRYIMTQRQQLGHLFSSLPD
jgi:GTP cyclohydrolase II